MDRKESMAQHLFIKLLDTYITDARIRFTIDGRSIIVGKCPQSGNEDETVATVRINQKRFFSRVLCYGNLGMGEAFMDEDFDIVKGTLHNFLTVLLRNRLADKTGRDLRLASSILMMRLLSNLRGKKRNVRFHYDIGDDLFEAFLDQTMTYSCGYANSPGDSLEELQLNKLDRICRKLRLRPGDHILDIGCGFGGLLIYAAKNHGVSGLGITISKNQYERANNTILKQGLADRVRVELKDFRSVGGEFDKVVSVGMLEHVPRSQYSDYFKTVSRVLKPEGSGLIHCIGCGTVKNRHDPFIQRYIFPGSNQPKLSEIADSLERNCLAILDVENIKLHYAYTVLEWLGRFQSNAHALNTAKYDSRFKRMWEYYFSCGIAAAFASDSAVYQVLFTKHAVGEAPLRRV